VIVALSMSMFMMFMMMFIGTFSGMDIGGMVAVWMSCMVMSGAVVVRVGIIVFAMPLLVVRRQCDVAQSVLVENHMPAQMVNFLAQSIVAFGQLIQTTS